MLTRSYKDEKLGSVQDGPREQSERNSNPTTPSNLVFQFSEAYTRGTRQPCLSIQTAIQSKMSSLPATMRAVVLKNPFEVIVEDRPTPKIEGDTEAVIKVYQSGLCGMFILVSELTVRI